VFLPPLDSPHVLHPFQTGTPTLGLDGGRRGDILFNVDPLKLNAAPTIFISAVVVGECSWFF